MASQKHLKELLEEDQEPFKLQSYISDHRCQNKRPLSPGINLQVRKRRPTTQNAGFPSRFSRNACFLSFRESPDPRKSPIFEFRSPNRSPNAIFLNIPAKTAAFLVEAAVRIQKQSSSEGSKTRTRNAGKAFGLFGSVLKKLRNRKKRGIGGGDDDGKVSVKDILRWESPVVPKIATGNTKPKEIAVAINEPEKSALETRISWRSSSSGVWSEIHGMESWHGDSETSSSSRSDGFDELTCKAMKGGDFTDDYYGKRFLESPFHCVLHTSPSPCGFQTQIFASPAASPHRCCQKKEERDEIEKLKKVAMAEEEKEQKSPVSVLDPPFQDDDEDTHLLNIPSTTFRSVERAKQQLLQKLRRFEKLADLDPVELQKQVSSGHETLEYDEEKEEEEDDVDTSHYNRCCHELTQRVLEIYFDDELKRVPDGIEWLISDIVAEEAEERDFLIDGEAMAKRVCERLESWRVEVESNTIDMMIEQDFRSQGVVGLWTKNDQEVQETALEIEYEIFWDLVDELSELVQGW